MQREAVTRVQIPARVSFSFLSSWFSHVSHTMTLIEKSLDQMLEEIQDGQCIFFDYWKPQESPQRHQTRTENNSLTYLDISKPYLTEIINKIPQTTGVIPDNLMYTVLTQAFENALTRGNQTELSQYLSLKIFTGKDGCVFRIRDSGNGFPYRAFIELMHQNDRSYRHGFATGLIVMDFPQYEVAYEGNGSIINLMFKRGYCQERSFELARYVHS